MYIYKENDNQTPNTSVARLKRKTSTRRPSCLGADVLNCGPSRKVSPTARTAPAAGTAGWRSGGNRLGLPPPKQPSALAGGDY